MAIPLTLHLDPNFVFDPPTVADVQVYNGQPYGNLPQLSDPRYDFLGWYTLSYGGKKISADTIVTKDEDHTLYAHWRLARYTISYDLQGGVGTFPSHVKTWGLPVPVSRDEPLKSSKSFAGWSPDPKNDYPKYQAGDLYKENSHVTLYAIWHEIYVDKGWINDTIRYTIDRYGKMMVYGYGQFPDYTSIDQAPWWKWRNHVRDLHIEEGITRIGHYTFYGLRNVTLIELPSTLVEIGNSAFVFNVNLPSLQLPAALSVVGDELYLNDKKLSM